MRILQDVLPPMDEFVFRLMFADRHRPRNLVNLLRALFPELAAREEDVAFVDPILNFGQPARTGMVSLMVAAGAGLAHSVEIIVSSNPLERVDASVFAKGRQIARMRQCLPEASPRCHVSTVLIASYPLAEAPANHLRRLELDLSDCQGEGAGRVTGTMWAYLLPNTPAELENRRLWAWLKFFGAKAAWEFAALAARFPDVADAYETLRGLSEDPRTARLYRDWLEAHNSRIMEVYRAKRPAELWPEAAKLFGAYGLREAAGPPTRH